MEELVKKDILDILYKAIDILKKEDTFALKELSNHTIHDASIFQDKDSILVAIIVYSLSKIIARTEYKKIDWHEAKEMIISEVAEAEKLLEEGNEEDYRLQIKKVLKNIGKVDESLQLYIVDVFEKARITKGAKLYEHGLSIGRVSDFLGISQWELMSYIGKTQIVDKYEEEVIPITMRLDHAKKVFNLK